MKLPLASFSYKVKPSLKLVNSGLLMFMDCICIQFMVFKPTTIAGGPQLLVLCIFT